MIVLVATAHDEFTKIKSKIWANILKKKLYYL